MWKFIESPSEPYWLTCAHRKYQENQSEYNGKESVASNHFLRVQDQMTLMSWIMVLHEVWHNQIQNFQELDLTLISFCFKNHKYDVKPNKAAKICKRNSHMGFWSWLCVAMARNLESIAIVTNCLPSVAIDRTRILYLRCTHACWHHNLSDH